MVAPALYRGRVMPGRVTTITHHCSWCKVIKVSDRAKERCPLCDGWMIQGTLPHGNYSPLMQNANHAYFARLATDNRGVR